MQIETQLIKLHTKLTKAEDTRLEEDDLTRLRKHLEHLDTRARQTFDHIAQHLKDKGVSAEILHRHQAMVTTYEVELAMLRRNLDALAASSTDAVRRHQATQALRHLQGKQQRRTTRRFDPNNLPFRIPDGKVRKPKETKKEFQSSFFEPQPIQVAAADLLPGLLVGAATVTLPATPTPDDLAATEDVQLTEDIKTLATSLGHNPVKIFNWVHDHIRHYRG